MKLFGKIEKRVVHWLAGLHLGGLYTYGMLHQPLWTAGAALVWLLVTLHQWPEEAER